MLFDSHAHLDDEKFSQDRYEVINKARESGVSYILNASSDLVSAKNSISLAEDFEFIYAAVGIHPHCAGEMEDSTLDTVRDLAGHKKVVAIGEIGLDYYYDTAPRDIQKYWFARQLDLARELELPVIVHDRDAHEDILDIIKSQDLRGVGGVFHCFSGSVEMAKEVLDNNFYISVSGVVTFKNAKKIIDVVKYTPLDRLLIETDCPYLTPEPFRGKRNDSGYVRLVAEKIASIKGLSFESVASITLNNARQLLSI